MQLTMNCGGQVNDNLYITIIWFVRVMHWDNWHQYILHNGITEG